MKKQMAITIDAVGDIHMLMDDKFLAHREFPSESREINRISMIEYDTKRDGFVIRWLRGPWKGQLTGDRHVAEMDGQPWDKKQDAGVLIAHTYGLAVDMEVQLANYLRLKGHNFEE